MNPKVIPYRARRHQYTEAAIAERVDWARAVAGADLTPLRRCGHEARQLAGNIENYVGSVSIPVGIAGPMLIKGQHAAGYIPVPIATTEGALVSSASRGALAARLSGGLLPHVSRQRMVRAPVFFFHTPSQASRFEAWVMAHLEEIRNKAHNASSIAVLKELAPLVIGATVHLRFSYTTGDAAGQNMTSACTWLACEWIKDQICHAFGFRFYVVEGNLSGDKKASPANAVLGRGVTASCTCEIPNRVLQRVFRTNADHLLECWSAAEAGSTLLGSTNANANFSNVIAGVFAATGQDIGCVHESACGTLKLLRTPEGLRATALLPSLVIGTVGGGTGLPGQRACLELMGCHGPGKLLRFAEILVSTCLALDLSTIGAVAANEFVSAHQRLGRNHPALELRLEDLDEAFFNGLLGAPESTVTAVSEQPLRSHSGIVTKLDKAGPFGIRRYTLATQTPAGPQLQSAVLKLKPKEARVLEVGEQLAKLSGDDALQGLFATHSFIFGFDNSQAREAALYQVAREELLQFCPKLLGARVHEDRGYAALLLEDLSSCSHLDTALHPERWDDASIRVVLDGLAELHSVYLNDVGALPQALPLEALSADRIEEASPLLRGLTDYNASRHPALMPPHVKRACHQFIATPHESVAHLQAFGLTLTHNDFNPRNLCLREAEGERKLVVYDWELAMVQNPELDLVEFLVYTLQPDQLVPRFLRFAEYYRDRLADRGAAALSRQRHTECLFLNAQLLAVVRLNLYLLAHNVLKLEFLERVCTNLACLMEALGPAKRSMSQRASHSVERPALRQRER